MVERHTPERQREIQAFFLQSDTDNDRRINFKEFRELLANLEAESSLEEARIGFEAIDTDRNGLIDFDEFLAWWQEP